MMLNVLRTLERLMFFEHLSTLSQYLPESISCDALRNLSWPAPSPSGGFPSSALKTSVMYSPASVILSISRSNLSFTQACQSASRMITFTPSSSMLRMVSASSIQPKCALPLGSSPIYATSWSSPECVDPPETTDATCPTPTTSAQPANIRETRERPSSSSDERGSSSFMIHLIRAVWPVSPRVLPPSCCLPAPTRPRFPQS